MFIKEMSTPLFGAIQQKKQSASGVSNLLSNFMLQPRIFNVPAFPQLLPQWEI